MDSKVRFWEPFPLCSKQSVIFQSAAVWAYDIPDHNSICIDNYYTSSAHTSYRDR